MTEPKFGDDHLVYVASGIFAGLLERAILPEATGRCKRLD